MQIAIRNAQPGDERVLALIQTESWKSAFRGIIPDEMLAGSTDISRVHAMYERMLRDKRGFGYLLFEDEKPGMAAWWDTARDEDLTGWAELIMIHSLPAFRRKGHGEAVLKRVFADARSAGFRHIALWVFTQNTAARAFYEAMGFTPDGCTKQGFGAEELRYARDL